MLSFKTENNLTFFAIIATNPVDIVFEQPVDIIKKENINYVTW